MSTLTATARSAKSSSFPKERRPMTRFFAQSEHGQTSCERAWNYPSSIVKRTSFISLISVITIA